MYIQAVNNYQTILPLYSTKKNMQQKIIPIQQDTFEKVTFNGKPKLTPEQIEQVADLKVFNHHVYEFKKGIRTLILTTEKAKHKDVIEHKLQKENIAYHIQDVDEKKINVYFGEKPCVEVVKTLNPRLCDQTPQEDFMLGILLGYDKVKQCERYLDFRNRSKNRWSI